MRFLYSLFFLLTVFTNPVLADELAYDFAVSELPPELSVPFPEWIAPHTTQLVGGIVSPLSGMLSLHERDMTVQGAQEIAIERFYTDLYMPRSFHKNWDQDRCYIMHYLRKNYKGWTFFPHVRLEFKKNEVHLTTPQGARYDFRVAKGQTTLLKSYGASNLGPNEMPGGQYDPRNTRIIIGDKNIVTVFSPEGSTRIYLKMPSNSYLLSKEILPNGKVLKYQYRMNELVAVESFDPEERTRYAYIQIEGSPKQGALDLLSSTGQNSHYSFESRRYRGHFRKEGHTVRFDEKTPPLLLRASTPHYREENISYADSYHFIEQFSGKERLFKVEVASSFGEPSHYRINKIFFPSGEEGEFVLHYELDYQPAIEGEKAGKTVVKNHDGTTTSYHFSENLLTTSVQTFGVDGKLAKEKLFSWNEKQWLAALEVRDGNHNLYHKKSYEYDSYGNPIVECFSGDLRGEGKIESYTIKRQYSQDGRNLLLHEEDEEGKITTFAYLPNTNLITQKITRADTLFIREENFYDSSQNLIRSTIDDGHEKRIIQLKLKQSDPFLHMPEWVEEKYEENGVEKLLRHVHLERDSYGNIVREEIYDSNNCYAYTITRRYDEQGNLIEETSPLKETVRAKYDTKGRLIERSEGRITEKRDYDVMGHLLKKEVRGDDGVVHTSRYFYEGDDLIRKIDPYWNYSSYEYDPITHQTTKTTTLIIITSDGKSKEVRTISTYDALGRELTKKDASGNIYTYSYNAYGSPTEILYPNGSKERFYYFKNGNLLRHKDRDGLVTNYGYDRWGRVILESYGKEGSKWFVYDAFHLLKESDLEGHETHYRYDDAGRKNAEERCGRQKLFTYDALGRVASLQEEDCITSFTRDWEGKVLEERKSDEQGTLLSKVNYAYNKENQLESITRYIDGQKAVERFLYDSLGREIEQQDGSGNKRITTYNDAKKQIIKVDPQGCTYKEWLDPYQRITARESCDPKGITLSYWEKYYDPSGNLLDWHEHLYEAGAWQSEQVTHFTYTPLHQIESITRAFGQPEARTSTYGYTPGGKLSTKTLPDGNALSYQYTPLGYLCERSSADGRIQHRFKCNRKGELLSAVDAVTKVAIQREVDPFGNVTKESFPNNMQVDKTYDRLNRLANVKISKVGRITYEYDALYLREIRRFSTKDELQYRHCYNEYDLAGNLTDETLIDGSNIEHRLDKQGRRIALQSPYLSQTCQYDEKGNMIKSTRDRESSHYTYDPLRQLTSENKDHYRYDSLLNRKEKNGERYAINPLNEIVDKVYDLNGNQLHNGEFSYTYDPLNRLIEAASDTQRICFQYDPLGRRLNKKIFEKKETDWQEVDAEYYLYEGKDEIGAVTSKGQLKNFRVLGATIREGTRETVAIEIEGQVNAALADMQGNICKLVDPLSKKVTSHYNFTAFGEERKRVEDGNPWRYAGKRYDPELQLIYFGKRYYDPNLSRWLTPDPAGFLDSLNLYQFALNNPYSYYDPDGEFVFLACIPFALFFTPAVISVCAEAVLAGLVSWGVYEGTKYAAAEMGGSRALAENSWRAITNSLGLSGGFIHYKIDKAKEEKKKENSDKKPPYDGSKLGDDPTKCPEEGFEWKGKGTPSDGKGSWHNSNTEESLHPDFNHLPPIKPHWDYRNANGDAARLYIDGTWEWKY